ncbi:hypothetical protein E0H73_44940 [Kribbella pittospori]|uniref:Uncharacterized protein n=1 Tax=Kribbella pittospori TaxID=722689 RepID=A0A4R0JGY1_9ACTN|nr:hypothetical protein [Kribbella pittospori]TCC45370.1 hypothetical protein E0H73_44940 [Kribbella pittospori]
MSNSAEDSLQEAGAALRHAVEILRRRPADDVAAKCLVAEVHELRSLMSTVALLMTSIELPRFVGWLDQQTNENAAAVLDEADADLTAAFDHLNSAAACLTGVRQSSTPCADRGGEEDLPPMQSRTRTTSLALGKAPVDSPGATVAPREHRCYSESRAAFSRFDLGLCE